MNTAKRALPMLETVKVASPCPADWNEMIGDDKVRYCGSCEKNVYNLSAMTALDAEQLLATRSADLCVRFYQRADGTVMTSDCPVGVKRQRRKKLALAVAGAGALAWGAVAQLEKATRMGAMPDMMGEVAALDDVPHPVTTAPTAMGTVAPPPVEPPGRAIMGAPPALPQPPPPETVGKIVPANPQPVRHTLGRIPARH